MLFEILFVILLGILAGSITGLIPGLHINLVSLFLFVNSSLILEYFSPFAMVTFIAAMSITHTFVDFVPSIFLGAPDEDSALSVLPGHKLLLEGRGYEAVKLTLTGGFYALFTILLVTPIFIFILPKIYTISSQYMSFILILIFAFLIIKEKNKFWPLFLFLISGVFGIAVLNFAGINQPLFPLFSGLFGISMLAMSYIKKTKIPKQKVTKININKKEKIKAIFASIFSTPICSFLPGLGSAQAAVLSLSFFKNIKKETFLVLIGAINTIVMGLSFVALYSIGKTRTGSAAIIDKLFNNLNFNHLILILGVVFISGILAFYLTSVYSKLFIHKIAKVNYSLICLVVIIFIFITSYFISGPYSIIVLITGASIGIVATLKNVKKMFLMGCLMIPVILYYL